MQLCKIFNIDCVESVDLKRADRADNTALSNPDAGIVMAWMHPTPLLCDLDKIWSFPVEAEFQVGLFGGRVRLVDAERATRADILVYSVSRTNADEVEAVVRKLRPKVIFHNSDEHLTKTAGYQKSFDLVQLVYRQYADARLGHPNKKIKLLPLGYHCWDHPPPQTIRPMSKRSLAWCFIGTVKGQRKRLIRMMQASYGGQHFAGTTLRNKNHAILQNSVFVLCPRGNTNIECFRQYAASMHGCIPALVCTDQEWSDTYEKMQLTPPWLHAPTVPQLAALMRAADSDGMQRSVLNWWSAMRETIATTVLQAIA